MWVLVRLPQVEVRSAQVRRYQVVAQATDEPAPPVGAAVAADRWAQRLRRVAMALDLAAEGLAVPTCLTHLFRPCPQSSVKPLDE